LKVRGKWTYLYRAVDRAGEAVDFRLSAHRDVKAAKASFRKALETQGRAPMSITLDGYAASHRKVEGGRAAVGARKLLSRGFLAPTVSNSIESTTTHPRTTPKLPPLINT